ncbi:MAG: ABC transporter ATP-binding protein [Solirubrobacterales bacterium]
MLRIEGVWKSYPRWPAGGRTLRALAANRLPLLARRGPRTWALRDVSLEVSPGRAVAVIGRNGAGKSTLLRVASGLSPASRGAVTVPPGVASVLDLGDSFDPSLSGRENALTAAVVGGWTRAEASALLPAALGFAELEEHADAPVRTYSEGMKLRLAFGVIAQLEPDVLLVDEVIAVGDLAFQAKCMEWISGRRAAGTSLVLASHDLRLVERECEQAIWLEDGAIAAAGAVAEVVQRYEDAARERTLAATPEPGPDDGSGLELRHNRVGTQEVTIESVELRDATGEGIRQEPGRPARISPGDPLRLSLTVRSHRGAVHDPIVRVTINREHDDITCFETSTRDDGVGLGTVDGARVTLALDRLDLAPGRYLLDLGLFRADWDVVYDYHWHAIVLDVAEVPTSTRGPLFPPRRWELD